MIAVSALRLKARTENMVAGGDMRVSLDLAKVPFVDGLGLAVQVSGVHATHEAKGTRNGPGPRDRDEMC